MSDKSLFPPCASSISFRMGLPRVCVFCSTGSDSSHSVKMTYLAVLLYMGADGPLYAFSLFLPSIINQLGKSISTSCFTAYNSGSSICRFHCDTGQPIDGSSLCACLHIHLYRGVYGGPTRKTRVFHNVYPLSSSCHMSLADIQLNPAAFSVSVRKFLFIQRTTDAMM